MPRTRTSIPARPTLARLAAKLLSEAKSGGAARFERYRDDPVGFAREVLRLRVWDRQAEILEAVRDHNNVTVRSGHKIGKSTAAVAIAVWFVCTRKRGRVILTSSSDDQVRNILWRELARIYDPIRRIIGGTRQLDPGTGLRFEDGREIIGFATKKPENMAGLSGPEMLFIADEASGIDEVIFEALEGNRAGGAKLVMFSNPTRSSGKFYASFKDPKAREFWKRIHVSSEEAAAAGIPGLATKEYVAQRKAEWGVESPIYQIRVEGNFAEQNTNAVVGIAAVEAAQKRHDSTPLDGCLSIGVDVARYGDDESVIYPRRGLKLLEAKVLRSMDGIQVANEVMGVVKALALPKERPRVKVDVIGVGASVYDQLKAAHDRKEIELVEVNSSRRADDDDKYYNLRTQMHFAVAEWLASGGAIPPDDSKLEGELIAPVYDFDARGRQRVESKDEIKKRLGRSPDRSDGASLAIYEGRNRVHAPTPSTIHTYDSPMNGGF